MEAALAAKERERQEAEEAARRHAEEEKAAREQKQVRSSSNQQVYQNSMINLFYFIFLERGRYDSKKCLFINSGQLQPFWSSI